MAIKTLKELLSYLIKKQKVSIFKSKNPGILFLNGQYKELIQSVQEIKEMDIEVWESYHNDKWMTFLKNPNKSISTDNSDEAIKHLSNETIINYYACNGFCTKGKPWESEAGWHKGEWCDACISRMEDEL